MTILRSRSAWVGLLSTGLGIAAVVGASMTAIALPALAEPDTCLGLNLNAGAPASPDLQAVIDAAASSDTIQVTGLCKGSFEIAKSLTLIGKPTTARPIASLDGVGASSTLRTRGRASQIVLVDLRIAHGQALTGGGIHNGAAHLTLAGSSKVARNHASVGGGIATGSGQVTLTGTTRVARNGVTYRGGGIYSAAGPVTLNGSASVANNNAKEVEGGGIDAFRLTMNGHSSVSGNIGPGGVVAEWMSMNDWAVVARNPGGGIVAYKRLVMNDHAAVLRNSANWGGGISAGGILRMRDSSRVAGNRAKLGGGIIFGPDGRVVLRNSAKVRNNTADGGGGGIFLRVIGDRTHHEATLTMRGRSHVSQNTSLTSGGGIRNCGGKVFLYGNSRIRSNTALRGGGITNNDGVNTYPYHPGRVVLHDSSLVARNTATYGGGIFNKNGYVRIRIHAAVTRNEPNDCVHCSRGWSPA